MEKIIFDIRIDANREKVWNVLLGEETYPKWTSAFSENSRVETTWEKGSPARFYDVNDKDGGMVAVIEENIPFEFLSIKHLGAVKNGAEDQGSEEVQGWAGAMENYKLDTADGQTLLQIEMDSVPEFKDYFSKAWPEALHKVKEMAEMTD